MMWILQCISIARLLFKQTAGVPRVFHPTYIPNLLRTISNPAKRSFTLSVPVTSSVCFIIKV